MTESRSGARFAFSIETLFALSHPPSQSWVSLDLNHLCSYLLLTNISGAEVIRESIKLCDLGSSLLHENYRVLPKEASDLS